MIRQKLAAVVMAGGRGVRMRSRTAKHLHPILGRRMVDWVIEAVRPLQPSPLVIVASPDTKGEFAGLHVVVQQQPLGTGDAVRVARAAMPDADQVLVLSGDTPLLTTALLAELVQAHGATGAAATVLSFLPDEVRSYGRIMRNAQGNLRAIVEASDASPEELAVREVNSSIYVFEARLLWPALERLTPANAQGELYLTDAVRDIAEQGHSVAVHVSSDAAETEGINTRVELAAAAATLRDRINASHMLAGVTIVDPKSTWIEPGVVVEEDVTIYPFTTLRGDAHVAEGAVVHSHVVVDGARIGAGASVGPFCYLRPGTVLGAAAKAGTFVELKNAVLGDHAKVPHLSYIGDAQLGEGSNIGAGSITANFPHEPDQPKGRTKIGKNARIAVDTMLVAPVSLGDDVWTAAGSVITDDVPDNALVGFAPRQTIKEGRGGKRNR